MTENKRFTVDDGLENVFCWEINDKENEDTTYGELVKLLNELAEEKEYYQIKSGKCEEELLKLRRDNEQLKSDNFNLNKTVECLDETVKEQCNKIEWADECGVRWEEEYEKWKG